MKRVLLSAAVAVALLVPARSSANDLADHPANRQLFAMICATSIGFGLLDSTDCAELLFSSQALFPPLPAEIDPESVIRGSFATLFANALGGNAVAQLAVQTLFTSGAPVPYVALGSDRCDRFDAAASGCGCEALSSRGPSAGFGGVVGEGGTLQMPTLNQILTDEQESLLGCGRFWGTDCERDGIDLLGAEVSVLAQSFPGFEGDYGAFIESNGFLGYCIGCSDPAGVPFPVAGTASFDGVPVAVRYVGDELVVLPGARGPGDPGYDPDVDGCAGLGTTGCPASLVIPPGFGPVTGAAFANELAALSWNLLMTLVALSAPADGDTPADDEFDPSGPMRIGAGLCSFAQPQFCAGVRAFLLPARGGRQPIMRGGALYERNLFALLVPEPTSTSAGIAALLALIRLRTRVSRSCAGAAS